MANYIITNSPYFDMYIFKIPLVSYNFFIFQPPQIILAQVQLHRKIPIHTVSFNCDDTEANKFLNELSTETGGRFHYYNIYSTDPDGAKSIIVSILKYIGSILAAIEGTMGLTLLQFHSTIDYLESNEFAIFVYEILLDHNNNNPPPNIMQITFVMLLLLKQNKTKLPKTKKQNNNNEQKIYIDKINLWKKYMISVVTKTNYC